MAYAPRGARGLRFALFNYKSHCVYTMPDALLQMSQIGHSNDGRCKVDVDNLRSQDSQMAGDKAFNRGKLLNVGYLEAMKVDKFDCFVFQDADLLPETDKNLYMCDSQARHLASAINEMRYHVMFYNYAGGVIAMNRENFNRINGYSNSYWGWGNEDDDFSARHIF
nr:hypothetical protein BaRGS_027490 [Batillaria attramentaria]